ncbi:hypothetical protein P153DRAFT_291952 [Dothidotthia symphoricarpi CBS 119687]|uniref:Glycoside hydrolase family 3 protein n=1 Tax=Dothidotthia symphoricarpi CBS 119687 TaxID=1392245 RepID=A0A6A6AF13_9PLEO|nr:uncharacterized protein P153DRAFT_291952 [Dothidotthia symphoricarpi CBS 119687]KAF2129001.1 hypothetical protein P153DRAFT_291952 [Dothidotthia symphoricarpi CBS 119687]
MTSQATDRHSFATVQPNPPTTGSASLVHCPAEVLTRLRKLHEAEIITLFTPFVPHSPSSTLAKNTDPFEPLGRALPRRVRHVPYRLDHGMTETHAGFLPASGVVMIVICITENIMSRNTQAFAQQLKFARGITRKVEESWSTMQVPVVVLLVSDEPAGQSYSKAVQDFPVLVTTNNYTPAALTNAAAVLFGN